MRILLILFASLLAAEMPYLDFSDQQKIAVQNAIMAQVNGKTISMIDVKKKMDMLFYQNFPQYANSSQARLQYYESSWRSVLMDLIDHELILSDATDKDIKLTDGEIREVLEERFGPNVMQTLDKLNLTYEETWKMIKNELIVQRMSWWFIQSKAVQTVTPQEIRQAYRLYLAKNPSYTDWKYRVVSIRADHPNPELPEQVYQLLAESQKGPEALAEPLKKLETDGVSIQISNEYTAKTQELAEPHKAALESLAARTYSKPSIQKSRSDRKTVYRIFYLIDKSEHPAPSFEELSSQLRNELTQRAIAQESAHYLGRLRKHYGFDAQKDFPDDLHPFSLQ